MEPESADRLRRVVSRLARYLNASSTAEGLSPSQASILAIISSRGPLSAADVVTIEGLNPTMLSRVLGKLDRAGLVVRTPDPDDNRAIKVAATARGRVVSKRIRAERAKGLAGLVVGLAPHHQADLVRALPALEALVQELQSLGSRSAG